MEDIIGRLSKASRDLEQQVINRGGAVPPEWEALGKLREAIGLLCEARYGADPCYEAAVDAEPSDDGMIPF